MKLHYFKVENGVVNYEKIERLTAIDVKDKAFIQYGSVNKKGKVLKNAEVMINGKIEKVVDPTKVDYMEVSPKQMISDGIGLIPFLAHNNTTRVFMGSNMQSQATPLIDPQRPYIGTGMEEVIAKDSGALILAKQDGVVESVGLNYVSVKTKDLKSDKYKFQKFGKAKYRSMYRLRKKCSSW